MHSVTATTLSLLILCALLPVLHAAVPSALRPTITTCRAHCPKHHHCVGTTRHKRCAPVRRIGQSCGRNPYRVCRDGLTCENHTCRQHIVPLNGRCSPAGMKCRDGLVCAGTKTVKKCVKPMAFGMMCKGDPWWVCKEGLLCRGGVCQPDRIPKGGSCRYKGSVCEEGLVCSGTHDNPRCVMPMRKGQACRKGDPYWICEDGLICGGTKENPRCVMPMDKGQPCRKNDPYWVCVDGLVCHGETKQGRCVMIMRENEPCRRGDPNWICDDGLECKAGKCVQVEED